MSRGRPAKELDATGPSSEPAALNRRDLAWHHGAGIAAGWLARPDPARAGSGRRRASGRRGNADPVPDRLHDPALLAVPAPARPDRHQGGRLPACRLGHDARGRARSETPVLAADAPPDRAKELGKRCRDLGLEPLMMFSGIYPEADEALKVLRQRIHQAEAGGVPQVLTFGHTRGGNRKLWVERFKQLGPMARDHGVTIVVKQHGGETGHGRRLRGDRPRGQRRGDQGQLRRRQRDGLPGRRPDPRPSKLCRGSAISFCIKDHRNTPRDEDCGPGFGEIDHYKLLGLVAFTGRTMPLCCENIFAPLLPRPGTAAEIDALARGPASSSRS